MSFISLKEKRFGRNSIWWVAFIHAASIYGMIVGGHWIAYVLCGSTLAVIWVASYFDWRALLKIDHGHPNKHRVDICEGCDPVCYAKDGAPLSFRDWYTTTRGDTAEELARIIVHAPIWRIQELEKQHAEYLLHPKFRNYPKP